MEAVSSPGDEIRRMVTRVFCATDDVTGPPVDPGGKCRMVAQGMRGPAAVEAAQFCCGGRGGSEEGLLAFPSCSSSGPWQPQADIGASRGLAASCFPSEPLHRPLHHQDRPQGELRSPHARLIIKLDHLTLGRVRIGPQQGFQCSDGAVIFEACGIAHSIPAYSVMGGAV